MRHSHCLEGFAFGLRPVELDDAEFIVELRTGDAQRTKYLHPVSSDIQQQRNWLAHYFTRENDFYWVVERLGSKQREGLVGIYDVKSAEGTAEWGRWILRVSSLAAAESALLVYRAAFDCLHLSSIYCITVADNRSVLLFHDSCGLSRVASLKDFYNFGGVTHDGVKHLCTRQEWPAVQRNLESHARMIARRVSRAF